jgi:parvulin-like peptidyl-prolyl isomerase
VARISVILADSEGLADELVMRITEDEDDFHQLAREYSLDETTKYSGGYLGVINRRSLSPELAAKVFNANAGDILGPFPSDENYQLILVEEVKKAELNDPVKNAIKEAIFNGWLSRYIDSPIQVNLSMN